MKIHFHCASAENTQPVQQIPCACWLLTFANGIPAPFFPLPVATFFLRFVVADCHSLILNLGPLPSWIALRFPFWKTTTVKNAGQYRAAKKWTRADDFTREDTFSKRFFPILGHFCAPGCLFFLAQPHRSLQIPTFNIKASVACGESLMHCRETDVASRVSWRQREKESEKLCVAMIFDTPKSTRITFGIAAALLLVVVGLNVVRQGKDMTLSCFLHQSFVTFDTSSKFLPLFTWPHVYLLPFPLFDNRSRAWRWVPPHGRGWQELIHWAWLFPLVQKKAPNIQRGNWDLCFHSLRSHLPHKKIEGKIYCSLREG